MTPKRILIAILLALCAVSQTVAQDGTNAQQPEAQSAAEGKATKGKEAQEKEVGQKLKIEPDQKYLVLATIKTSTMQKELDEAASRGFRVVMGSPTVTAEMAVLLERIPEGSPNYQYKLLATTKISTMRKELNEMARDGYRLIQRTATSKEGFLSVEIVLVMERAPNSDKRYEYNLIAAGRESKLMKKIPEAESEGYRIVEMVSRGEHAVIMEREARGEGQQVGQR